MGAKMKRSRRRGKLVGEWKMSRRGRREAARQSCHHQWEGAHREGRCSPGREYFERRGPTNAYKRE